MDCSFCGFEIGQEVEYKTAILLKMGNAFAREVRGFCPNCGRPFRFSVSDNCLTEIIKKTGKLRNS